MGWRAIARSATGTRHQQQQQPCQDYGAVMVPTGDRQGVIVGAVADGAGSAPHADVGAKLAVSTSLNFLTASEAWLQRHQRSWQRWPESPSAELIQNLFLKVVTRVRSRLQQQADSQGYAIDDLACTLLAFLATPDWIAAMQIGDGFMVVRCTPQGTRSIGMPAEPQYHLMFQPDRGEFANQTTFVTAANALEAMQVRVVTEPPQFICAATDGIERVALRFKDWQPFTPFFRPLEEYLWETPHPEADDAYLVSFLTSERLNQKTDDDKTLVLCCYDRQT